MPYWPYAQAVDDALTARGIPPGTVRASRTSLDRGLTMYTVMTWDVSRTGGRDGLQLHWQERQGWFYALAGLSQFDVHFYTVLTPLRTPMPAPEAVADVAEHLVRFRRFTETEHGQQWEGAGDVRVAANDFRRARLGLPPLGRQWPGEGTGTGTENREMEGEGVQLTIDTQTDSYEQAIAAVQAAYGLNPAAVTSSWPDVPTHEPRPGPETLAGEDLGQGWTERMLFDSIAAVMPRARAVLRRLVEVGGTATHDDIQAHFAGHPETPLPTTEPSGWNETRAYASTGSSPPSWKA
ncbi:DUF6292 family protein [Streptomyces sp. NPDC005374]|uniref:DUF6292 family protein n=1 Tax=Streptomyces sp. NPDC005374 TaxID=3364713 RepID=UPI003683BC66